MRSGNKCFSNTSDFVFQSLRNNRLHAVILGGILERLTGTTDSQLA